MMTEKDFYNQVVLGSQVKDDAGSKNNKVVGSLTKISSSTQNNNQTTDQSNVQSSSTATTTEPSQDAQALGTPSPTKISTDTGTLGTNSVNPSGIMSCFVINKITEETIVFHAYPSELSESYSAGFDSQGIMGRSAPYFSYTGNEARNISYSLTLQEDICPNLTRIVERLKALVYPRYSGSLVQPPYCYIKFGDMVACHAILESIDFSWGETVLADSQHFSKVDINFSYQELRLNSLPVANGTFNE